MTVTMERPHYVGTRRYDAVPAAARIARHRRARPTARTALAAATSLVRRAAARAASARVPSLGAASMTVRVVAALVFVFGISLGLVAVLLLVESTPGAVPYAPVVTPSPTPFPSGWTYGR